MDGYDATRLIRKFLFSMNLEQPIISAITGHIEDNNVNKALEAGMNYVTSKPIKVDIIKHLLT
jgi:CheY-like chemotaxis protein